MMEKIVVVIKYLFIFRIAENNAGRRTCVNDVARFEGHVLGNIADDRSRIEDQITRIGVLTERAVDVALYL